jgi:beta-N-acetylglucosaminidase
MKKYINLKFITILTIILFFVLVYFFVNEFQFLNTNEALAVFEESKDIEILDNKNVLDISKILKENTSSNIKEEMQYEVIDLEYTTEYVKNENLPSGTIWVSQIGIDGKQSTIIIKKYDGDELISEEIVATNVDKAAINKQVEIGTGKGKNNYELKAGDTVYSTPAGLPVMQECDSNSEKLITLGKGTEVKVIEVFENGWSYVGVGSRKGYVLSEGLSNINPIRITETEENGAELSKEELLARLSFDMNVGEESNLSLEQFRKILQNQPSDINNIFSDNADYFYYAEQEYGINGVFLAAVAIHESAWGTSNIARAKKNLFGYMAYDNSPYLSAMSFSTYSEGIDLLARVFMKYYLNPSGTEIYGGNIAEGKYYNGNTVSSVNKCYATDSNWAKSVYNIMKKLYEKL